MLAPIVVFDLDGTLVDTAPDLVATLNRVLDDLGLPSVPYAEARITPTTLQIAHDHSRDLKPRSANCRTAAVAWQYAPTSWNGLPGACWTPWD